MQVETAHVPKVGLQTQACTVNQPFVGTALACLLGILVYVSLHTVTDIATGLHSKADT